MGQQAVVRHADAEHAGDDVQDERGEHRAVVDEEERRDRADVKPIMAIAVIQFTPFWYLRPYRSAGAAIGTPRSERR
jgi:hypothetical protein